LRGYEANIVGYNEVSGRQLTDRVNYSKIIPLKYTTIGRTSKHKGSDMKNVKMCCRKEFN